MCFPLASLEHEFVTGDQRPPGLGEPLPRLCQLALRHVTLPGGGAGHLQGTTHHAGYFRFDADIFTLCLAYTHTVLPAGFAPVGTDLICELKASSAPVSTRGNG